MSVRQLNHKKNNKDWLELEIRETVKSYLQPLQSEMNGHFI